MGQRIGLWNILLFLVSSLLLFLLALGIVIVPAQAQQKAPASAQVVVTAHPQSIPAVGPTVTAVRKEHLAQQGKQLQNGNFGSWMTLRLILVGGAGLLLLTTLSGFMLWSRRRLVVAVRRGQPPLIRDLPGHGLPSAFVSRPAQLAQLRDALVDKKSRWPRRVALVGMSGAGKSVLAEAAALDPAIRKIYPEVAWVFLSQQSSLKDCQHVLAKQLGSTATVINVEDGRNLLGELLADRACLIVVDNAWTKEDLRAFDVVGKRYALLVTTRDAELARRFEMTSVEVDVLDDGQARALLAAWAHQELAALPPAALDVAHEVGNLALGLAMAGALAGDGDIGWKDVLSLLQAAKLDVIGSPVSPDYPYETLQKAIQVSINALESGPQWRYLELAVFNGRGPVPVAAVEALWAPAPIEVIPTETHRLLALFGQRSLLRRHPDGRVSRHDLQGDVAANLLGPSGLALAHTQLLTGYWARCPDGWPSVVPDGYVFEHLATQLAAAGRHEELQRLLVDFDWLRAKLRATDVNAVLADYEADKELAADPNLRLVQAALRLSAHVLARDPTQLPGHLVGRLLTHQQPVIQALLAQARAWHGEPWLCPRFPSLTPAGGPLWRILAGHTDWVTAVAVADGQVISGAADHTLRVWDLASGQCQHVLTGHTDWVTAVAVADRRVISGAADHMLRVWDLASGQCQHVLKGHIGGVLALAVADRRVISGSDDHTLRVWDLDGGQCQHILTGHTGGVLALAVADGRAISGAADHTLRVWDLDSGQCQHILTGHTDRVTAVAVADGRAISGAGDGTLRVWDLDSGQCQHILAGHTDWVTAMAVADGQVISGAADHTLRMWDLASGQCQHVLTGHTEWVTAVAVADRQVISSSGDSTLRMWDLASGECQHVLTGHIGGVRVVVVANGRVISGAGDGTLRVWDLASEQRQHVLAGHTDRVTAVAVADEQVISGAGDGMLRIWDLASGQCQHVLTGHTDRVWVVAVADRRVISGAGDGTLRVWDLDSGQCQHILTGHTGGVGALAVTDGRVISSSVDHTLRVWDLDSGQCQQVLTGHTGGVLALAVTDGRVISSSVDHTLRVWDLASGQCQQVLTGHTAWVGALAVTDGRVISSSGDGTLRVWDLASGQCQHVLTGHTGRVRAVAVADGQVISGAADHTLRVWDLDSGECQHILTGHTGGMLAVADRRVISGAADHTLRVWDLDGRHKVAQWEGEADFGVCDAMVLDTGARDDRHSLVIAAGDAGGHVHVLQLLGDRDTA